VYAESVARSDSAKRSKGDEKEEQREGAKVEDGGTT